MDLRPPERIEGDGVVLRRMTSGDAPELVGAVTESGPDLSRYESWARPDFSAADALAYVVWWDRAWDEGRAFYYAVEDEDGRMCGSCGLGQVDGEARAASVGYWIRSTAAGRGLATAAVEAIAGAAFGVAGFARLSIVAAASNGGSRRVAEKVGAVEHPGFEGTVYESGMQVRAVEYVLAP
jgi:ribosomal-protein-serine acetyltransferase